MYSGTTLNNFSGAIVGTHQKINRTAYHILKQSVSSKHMPDLKLIQHFEGKNGPDGLKRKSPGKDDVCHFCNPDDPSDSELLEIIDTHYDNLVVALRSKNLEKAAFEASWLSHALVDGLTPAHHFPYHEEVEKLREGKQFSNLFDKLIFRGANLFDTFKKNWQFWGARGLLSTHSLFEWGVSAIVMLRRMPKGVSVSLDRANSIRHMEASRIFQRALVKVDELNMYERFNQNGWTLRIAQDTHQQLIPRIEETVATIWVKALNEAGMTGKFLPDSTQPQRKKTRLAVEYNS